MRALVTFILCAALFNTDAFAASPRTVTVSADEALAWVRHTVPLPKQIEIASKVVIPVNQVAIKAGPLSAPLVAQAVKELHESLNHTPSAPGVELERFTVTFQLGGPKTQSLKGLKNSNQAYQILSDKKGKGLEIISLTPRGLYYAAKTLQQLIQAKLADGKVEMPLLTVTDWPDVADRGVWGTDTPFHIRWLGERKFNYMEQVATHFIDENKRSVVSMNETRGRMLEEGPKYGIQPVPAIVHLERLGSKGVYKAYPDLKGQGEGVHEGAACYSNPKIVEVLADWIVGCGQLPGVTEVDVWLTENLAQKPGCQCEKCSQDNRDLLEVRAVVAAWQKAKKTIPNVGLRVLTSEETADSNEQIIAMLPPEVKVWYYHSLLTYNNREMEIIPPYLEKLAKQGRNFGVVPDLGVKGQLVQPFTSAHYIRYRMNEFADKDITSLMGYPRPRVYYCNFNTEAAAEWSWNAKGRSTREFALSWAVRQGMDDPEPFAEWSETIGPVAWDVYGCEWPHGERRRALEPVALQLKKGTLPKLGEVLWEIYPKPWGDIKSVSQLNQDVTDAAKAVKLAQRMGIARYVEESRVIQGYIDSLKALYELKQVIQPPDAIAEEDRGAAGTYFQSYIYSLRQVQEAVIKWEQAIGPWPGHPSIAEKTKTFLDTLIEEMISVAEEFGYQLK
ncbi:MAG: glycoside hydrolase family 20 zincin-like fold domain-containing protein [Planctomycetota bacterium]|jgi:hypothetical protein